MSPVLHRLVQLSQTTASIQERQKSLFLPNLTNLAGHSSSISAFATGSKAEPRTITSNPLFTFLQPPFIVAIATAQYLFSFSKYTRAKGSTLKLLRDMLSGELNFNGQITKLQSQHKPTVSSQAKARAMQGLQICAPKLVIYVNLCP